MTNLTQNSFSIRLFQFSTCFEQPRAYHQENQFYQYNVWYVSLCVGDRLVCRSGRNFLPYMHTRRSPTQSDTYQTLYWYKWFSWWWERGCSKHVENWNKHMEKELCFKFSIYKNIFWHVGYIHYLYCRSTLLLEWCVCRLFDFEFLTTCWTIYSADSLISILCAVQNVLLFWLISEYNIEICLREFSVQKTFHYIESITCILWIVKSFEHLQNIHPADPLWLQCYC
jgi:hypothetical protein